MTAAKNIGITLIFLITSNIAFGQQDLLITHYHQFDVKDQKTSYVGYTSNNNEAQLLASLFFLFYKQFISSQDMNSCVFTPSCSVYTMQSVKSKGFIIGIISGFDRLSRCHPLGQKYYPIDPVTKKLYDPVQ
jgi:uncharacterized protein